MQHNQPSFTERLSVLTQGNIAQSLKDIRHGIERETLRVKPDGGIAQTPHPESLGKTLTHDWITTDFSESLLEFITPAESSVSTTLTQLHDIHKFVYQQLGEERLWPLSMPCFIANQDEIPLAQYGTANVAKMKTLYRQGLKNRYGAMMQAIAGVHFNFSLPKAFWQQWLPATTGQDANKDSVSAAYFAMIRNYRRHCWMIPYLFGASPALCGSFLEGRTSALPFKSLGKGTLYLPYATSLRMSDLGYTNKAQSGLFICYNEMDQYISSLRRAIRTPSKEFARFHSDKEPLQQLNSNVLQIENELYSPIRPKQPTGSLEKPTDALAERGVEYIEVRALDVNPFSSVGIDKTQIYFLDVFLLHCLLLPSAALDPDGFAETEKNISAVVKEGRKPGLMLQREGQSLSLHAWAESIFEQMAPIAALLDEVNETDQYSDALAQQQAKFADPSLTPSAMLLEQMLQRNLDNGYLALELAEKYRTQALAEEYRHYDEAFFRQQARKSIEAHQQIEAQPQVPFTQFLAEYFTYQE